MRVHYIQHVAFETPRNIKTYLDEMASTNTVTHLYQNEPLPDAEAFDVLVVMGGPMGVYDEAQYPWLIREKALIKSAIEMNKYVLGICLGAQLIADVLGAKVYKGAEKEIGWYKIYPYKAKDSAGQMVFHWHGDTFDLPNGAKGLYSSEVTLNQAFECNKKVIGLQFHLEMTEEAVKEIVEHCSDELVAGAHIQDSQSMTEDNRWYESNQLLLKQLLDRWIQD